jgi:ribose transport system ATP-binding protein
LGSYLEMRKISKSFGENKVLDNIDFFAEKGQVHALIGENGAGKSTLMRILAGLFLPDAGEIWINGRPEVIDGPKKSQELGIAMIHQDIKLFPDLNITENIYVRREPIRKIKFFSYIDWDKAYRETRKYLNDFGLRLHPNTLVKTLSTGQQKLLEVIKALSQNAEILIMDEPTSALTENEVSLLFNVIREVKKRGVAVIYISHRLGEIKQIADRVTVLRDGEVVQTSDVGEVDIDSIVRIMAGKEIEDRYPKIKVKPGKEILRVEGLGYKDIIRDINFSVKKGEIVGVTGLSGSGRRTLAKVLFGINSPYDGRITINGKTFKTLTPSIAKKNGLCYVTAVRTDEGLISNTNITKNITITNLRRVSTAGFIKPATESEYADDYIDRLEIKSNGYEIIDNLSGGKQKKIIFAKWLFTNAKIILIEEPTAGIDIGSKVDIYNIINELVLSGASVILISSDLSEVMGMCDRILVMFNGEIHKEFSKEEATQEKILFYASGGEKKE